MNANIYKLFRERFPEDGKTPFLIPTEGAPLLYGDLDRRTARMAGRLCAHGVEKGGRVAAQVEKSPEAVLLYLACLRLGAVYLPLNTAYTADEVAYFLQDAEPRVFIRHPQELNQDAPPFEDIAVMKEDNLAAILYTSGTTGRSKGAMISHGNLSSNALTLHRIWGWREGDMLLHALPIHHVHGLFTALHCALLNGSSALFATKFDAAEVIPLLPQATVMMGAPTYYARLLERPELTPGLCANMRLFISGSAPLRLETFAAFKTRTGHEILERYGMTEAGMIASNPLEGGRVAGTVGYPLPDVKARVDAETGVLEIAGPNVFKGYWRAPEKTDQAFRPGGWFITGDLAEISGDGRIAISGRATDMIISGGLNIYPKEVEDRLDLLSGVKESAVFGVAHPDLGEAACAAIAPDGTAEITEEAVRSALDGKLARFKIPKRVFLVDDMPRNAMGKTQKTKLRERYGGTFL